MNKKLSNLKSKSLLYHRKFRGKIGTKLLTPIKNIRNLSLAYTPGVASVCLEIHAIPQKVFDYTLKSHTVAIVTDGSAVLGLGNIGPLASIPVMEGKAALFKTFADLDAFPICLDTQDPDQIIQVVRYLAPVFGGINLEDISAPRCFEIENSLQDLGIPVMHDDQHGTAIVVLAGLLNAVKLADKKMSEIKVVVLGAGAAGNAVSQILAGQVTDVIVLDSQGIISPTRHDLDPYKRQLAKITNKRKISGGLQNALQHADVFIGVSKANLMPPEYIKLMNPKPIIFALANPHPEIMPDMAKKAGVFIIATGRSDFPNQINNCLAFPGVFKGALSSHATAITRDMKLNAACALARLVKRPKLDLIIPRPFDPGISLAVARAVANFAST